MVNFTDRKLYVKGTCVAQFADPSTGEILYSSNKFQSSGITSESDLGEIRAGLSNGIAAIIPSNSALSVNFTAADFNLYAKAMQIGATVQYGAPAPTCEVLTASGTTLTLEMPNGAPVAQAGYAKIFGYVQTVGQESKAAIDGVPYEIDPTSGEIQGFQATSGTQYKVWYFVRKASAQMATISALFDPKTVHFTAQMAVYANDGGGANNTGSRVGWLYVIIPRLKFDGTGGGLDGDQQTASTQSFTGQALSMDELVVSGTCSDCDAGTFGYYIYVEDAGASVFEGLAVVGGVVSLPVSTTAQIPVRLVAGNGELVQVGDTATGWTYTLNGAPTGTEVSASGLITAGTTPGDATCTVTYENGGDPLTATIQVSITEA